MIPNLAALSALLVALGWIVVSIATPPSAPWRLLLARYVAVVLYVAVLILLRLSIDLLLDPTLETLPS